MKRVVELINRVPLAPLVVPLAAVFGLWCVWSGHLVLGLIAVVVIMFGGV